MKQNPLETSYSYPDKLHPEVYRPLIESRGWPELAVLASRRHALGFLVSELSAAMGTYPSEISQRERGRVPVVAAWLARYARGLDRLVEAREARGREAVHQASAPELPTAA